MPYKKHLLTLLKTLEGTAIINNEMRKDISQLCKVNASRKRKNYSS